MLCVSCQTDNPPANRFCDQCGAPLDARCSQCNAVLRAGARFCGTCGHSLAPAQAASAAVVADTPARSIAYAEARAVLDDALVKARERKSHFNVGRITNSLGWLHQELGDFRSALEFNREAVELGRRHQIGNIEISAQLDIGGGLVRRGEAGPALSVFEEMIGRVEKGLGSHRWRWDMRVSVGLAEALLALGRGDEALAWIDRAVSTARPTGSAKYMGKCHALRGEHAVLGGRWDDAVTELGQALAIARRIEYPTLTWQAAHLLARAQAEARRPDEAIVTARLALETIDVVAAHAPDLALRKTFLAWQRVVAAREDLDRLIRV